MRTQTLEFYSDGIRLEGILQTPDQAGADQKLATIIVCSGLHGLKEWVPARWWPHLVAAGFQCFAFDYRGFGTSEGQRGRMIPEEEIRDVLHAATFLRTLENVDPERIALIGWGLGGGIVIEAAARDPGIAAVCCANGAGDYGRATRDAVSYPTWLAWQDRLARDRIERVLTGKSELVDYRDITHPGESGGYQAHGQFYKDLKALNQSPIDKFTLETCEAYTSFKPERVVDRIAPRPLLILHGARNEFMPVDEARRLYELAEQPKTLRIVPNGQHLELIDSDNPDCLPTMRLVTEWFGQALANHS